MNANIPTQDVEATFNISDYTNYGFDFDGPNMALHPRLGAPIARNPGGMVTEGPGAGFVQPAGAGFNGTFNPSESSDALHQGFEVTHGALHEYDNPNHFQFSQPSYTSGPEYMSSDLRGLTHASANFNLNGPFQTIRNSGIWPDASTAVEPAAFASYSDGASSHIWAPSRAQVSTQMQALPSIPAGLSRPLTFTGEMVPQPSRWMPASPEHQRYLNQAYAPQLSRLSTDPNQQLVLFLPAQGPSNMLMPNNYPQLIDESTANHRLSYSDTAAWTPSTSLPLLLESRPEVPPPQASGSDTDGLFLQRTEADTLIATRSNEKRASDVDDSEPEPAPKRHRTREAFEPNSNLGEADRPSGSSVSKKGPYWRYEHKSEFRLRVQRQKNWYHRQQSAKGEFPNRKMQRMLDEIIDTKEFAEVQDHEVEENGIRRPVRKGARKSYVGQE